eukprot:g20677.t1
MYYHSGSSSSGSSMSSVASSSGMVATSVVSSFGHDVVGVRVVLQLPHVRQVCMLLEAVNTSHRTAHRGSCCSCPVSSVPLGGGESIVHAASAAKFAFGVEEWCVWSTFTIVSRSPFSKSVDEWMPLGHVAELFVCRPIVGAIPSNAAASSFAYSLAVDAVWFGQLIGAKVYRRSVGCETPDAFAEVVVGANGVKHSVCRFGGIGGVSLIEVSSALVELNCRYRCSPMGVEVSS